MAETPTKFSPGIFCWADLGTVEPAKAFEFYQHLFGWGRNDVPTDRGPYTMLMKGESPLAGLFEQHKALKDIGMPAHWMGYVLVDNAAAAVARAKELGGEVLLQPLEVKDFGWLAVIEDPTGAPLAVWEVKPGPGPSTPPPRGVGTVCWNELLTPDAPAAEKFYTALFGWSASPRQYGDMPHIAFGIEGRDVAGMTQMPENPLHSPIWLTYFSVDDPDAIAALAEKHGGRILLPPTDQPEIGRFAVLVDPQGALFGIVKGSRRG